MTNLSDLLPAGAASKQLSFTASGAISSGQTVALQSNGTVKAVSGVAQAIGSPVVYESAGVTEIGAAYDANAQKVVIAYRDTGNSNYGTAVVGTVSGTSISFGTPVVFESAVTRYSAVAYDTNAQKVVIAYKDAGNSNSSTAIVGTVSGTSISFGTPVVFESQNSDNFAITYDANAQKVVIFYQTTSNEYGGAIVGTVSGTSISFGSAQSIENRVNTNLAITYDASAQKVVLAYKDNGNSNYGTAVVGTVSGTSISFGSTTTYNSTSSEETSIAYDANAQKVVIVYRDSGDSNYGKAVVGTVSGTSISFGSTTNFHNASTTYPSIAYDTNAKKVVIAYNNNNSAGEVLTGTVSGTSISFSSAVQFEGAASQHINAVYDSNASTVAIAYQDAGNSDYGTAAVFRALSTNSSSFLGIADAAISNAASGKITMKGGVAINSAISPAAVVTAGSQVVFDDGGPTTGISLVYDPDSTKIVTAFCTTTLHGIVGTVSGTGITYGTAVQANSNNSGEAQIVYDTANDKVVVVYTNNNNSYGEAVVGTVSGTSISWGSVVVWNSASTSGLSAAYDTNAGKVLVAWKNSGTASGIVGTVSGTSISFGSSATIFSGGNLQETRMVYDANAQKSVVAIRDYSPQKGYAVVATISGTSVTVGSSVEFLSSEVTSQSIALAYNSTDNNVVIAYSKAGDSNNGFLAIGTISGTSISFAGETKYSSSNQTNYVKLAYKSSGNMLGIIYNIGGSTTVKFNHATISGTTFSFGTEQELTAGATDSTAITLDVASDNFVASYGDGANSNDGTTNVVNLNTSLVPNTTYYVQNDGTLSTTSSTVTAGKAMSTTSINLDYST
jgi:hypothetical protein